MSPRPLPNLTRDAGRTPAEADAAAARLEAIAALAMAALAVLLVAAFTGGES